MPAAPPRLNAVAVIGAGAWGTALAIALRQAGRDVTLLTRSPEHATAIIASRRNDTYLPGIPLDPAIRVSADWAGEVNGADFIVLATPAQHLRDAAAQLTTLINRPLPVIIAAKGIELQSGKPMSAVLAETWPRAELAVLSGPGFAAEVGRGLPAAICLGVRREILGLKLAEAIGSPSLRPYWTRDVTGVELGGSLKNVIAIAVGIARGKGLGASAEAALLTRGFAEIRRYAEAAGAQSKTLMGLSGLGDLVLTAASPLSRNTSLGIELGKGRALGDILAERRSVAEGVATAAAAARLAREQGIAMPISTAVAAILAGNATVDTAIAELLARPFRPED